MFCNRSVLFSALLILSACFLPNGSAYAKTFPPLIIAAASTDTAACPKTEEIEKIIGEAISLGAPIYNEGLHLACYRIYEWAGYKIMYEYGEACPEAKKTLKTAIDKSHGDFSDTEKAWLMRAAFDKVLGVPTRTAPLKKSEAPL